MTSFSTDAGPHAAESSDTSRINFAKMLVEVEGLERRVLAHERVLQSLIAHMAETEPKFLNRLIDRFRDPLGMARSEHAYTSADGHADAFVNAIVRLAEHPVAARSFQDGALKEAGAHDSARAPVDSSETTTPAETTRVVVRNRSGVWEVKVDDRFYGDYSQKLHAENVADILRQLLVVEGAAHESVREELGRL